MSLSWFWCKSSPVPVCYFSLIFCVPLCTGAFRVHKPFADNTITVHNHPKSRHWKSHYDPPKKVKSMKHISLTFPSLVKNRVVCVLFTCCPSKGPFSLTVWCPPICIAPLHEGCASTCINPYLLVTQNVNWTFTLLLKRGRKKSWFDSRLSFCFKTKWTMKIETTDNFFHSQFPKHRRLTPRVHPIHRPPHAQGLAYFWWSLTAK